MLRPSLAGTLRLFIAIAAVSNLATAQSPWNGLTTISPNNSDTTTAIDLDENVVMTWVGADRPSSFAYILPDGSMIRPCRVDGGFFNVGGAGGRLQKFDPDGEVVWDYRMADAQHQQHHDIAVLPNGNVLAIAWELRTASEAAAMGRVNTTSDIWPDAIIELKPVGFDDAEVVWRWSFWDHLVQDVDPTLPNYGEIADHPELFDINLGPNGDWQHLNSVDYDPVRDHIVISARTLSELYVIDHSTTTEEAASHSGGNSGMGGDFLYRWGNPQNYGRGDEGDRQFFVMHGVNWVDHGFPGGGNIIGFNNGDMPGSSNDRSTVIEITPPFNGTTYDVPANMPFAPSEPAWEYIDPDFYGGPIQCGAFRLPNGDTLITANNDGYVFEIAPDESTVWDHDAPNAVARGPRFWIAGLDDWSLFADCVSGPGVPAIDCPTGDYDGDGDVDFHDAGLLQRKIGKFTGP